MTALRYAIAALVGLSLAALALAQAQGVPEKPEGVVVTPEKAHIYGAAQGKSLRSLLALETGERLVDLDLFSAAFRQAINTPGLELSKQEKEAGSAANLKIAMERRKRVVAAWDAKVAKNRADGDAWIASMRGRPGVIETASGLLYKVVERGNGARPSLDDILRMTFEEYTIAGELTRSTAAGNGSEFQVPRLITGLYEGVQLMPAGSTFEFYLSPDLGYGLFAGNSIGPDSAVRYTVTLEEVL